jgi:hypothetical protein
MWLRLKRCAGDLKRPRMRRIGTSQKRELLWLRYLVSKNPKAH